MDMDPLDEFLFYTGGCVASLVFWTIVTIIIYNLV